MKKYIITALMGISLTSVQAQEDRTQALVQSEEKGWEYELRAGVLIGGASPHGIP